MGVASSPVESEPAEPATVATSGVLERVRRRTGKNTFLSHVATLAGGTAIAQLLITLTAPILTRLYSPVEMGWFGTFSAYVAVASVAVSLRYEIAIVSARTGSEAGFLTVGSMLLAVPTTVLLGALMWLMMARNWLGLGALPASAVVWVSPAILAMQAFIILRYWYLRDERFRDIARITVYQGAARATAPIGLHLVGFGWLGLVLGEILGRLAGLWGMIRRALRELASADRRRWKRRLALTFWRNREFPFYSLPSGLLDAVALNVPIPLIGMTFGAAAAGQYALVQRIFQAPLALIGRNVSDAFHSRLAIYARERPQKMVPLFFRTTGLLLGFGLLLAVFVIALSGRGFVLIFGKQWSDAGAVAMLILPWTCSNLVVTPLSRVVQVLSGQRTKLIYDALTLSLIFGVILIAGANGASFMRTVLWLSIGQAVAYGVYYLLLLRIVSRGNQSRIAPSR